MLSKIASGLGVIAPTGSPATLCRRRAAIHAHEQTLTNAMVYGTGNLPGLAAMEGVHIIGGIESIQKRVKAWYQYMLTTLSLAEVVWLNDAGIRTIFEKPIIFWQYSGTAGAVRLCAGITVPLITARLRSHNFWPQCAILQCNAPADARAFATS